MQNVIIQPTPFCNINCKYCYLPHRNDTSRMSFETMERVFQRIFEYPDLASRILVVWHAGEPLVVGTDYYRRAFDLIKHLAPASTRIQQNINTNGMLIDQDWCAFFAEHKVNVGVSIDGPATFHDRMRVTRSGRGTHAETLAGINRLRENELPFYVISVLTSASLDHAREFYEFYRDNDIRFVCFNIEEIEGVNTSSSLSGSGVDQRFEKFLREFWRLVVEGGNRIRVREFENMLRDMTWPADRTYPHTQLYPYGHVTIDWQGNFSTFSPELLGLKDGRYGDFIIGNVTEDSLAGALQNPALQAMQAAILRGVEKCRATCEYFSVCGGGVPVNKLCELGDFDATETLYCRLNKKVVANIMLDIIDQVSARTEAEAAAP